MSASAPSAAGWHDDTTTDDTASKRRHWDGAWPLKGRELLLLLGAYVGVVGAWVLVGETYTGWTAPNAITRFDERVANWMVDHRTSFLNDLAKSCGYLADSYYKIGASVVIFLVFLWVWRRWYEAVYIALPLVFEACAFIVITHIVQRDRPDVEQLIKSEITTSFPSGHVAAATVYAAIAVIVFKHTRAVWARSLAVTLAVIVPLLVAWARVYQGVHYLTDTLAGIGLGATSLVITDRVLGRHEPADLRAE
jgi:undecaprenyl-diphosphatase